MTDIKSLNAVLPPDQRRLTTVKMADMIDAKLLLLTAKILQEKTTPIVSMTVSTGEKETPHALTASQEQIVSTVRYLIDNNLFPVYVMFINDGKSYAIIDPADKPAK